uniref:Uncharacterized protein n=1 Tax=Castor canadensis TaxID=51338 RepID=A0A8C0XH69_CASCN
MAGSSSPFSASRAEMNILEINKKLCFQLEETKQQLRYLKEKFLISEATVYRLLNGQQVQVDYKYLSYET